MDLWQSALSRCRCHWPDMKSSGPLRQNMCLKLINDSLHSGLTHFKRCSSHQKRCTTVLVQKCANVVDQLRHADVPVTATTVFSLNLLPCPPGTCLPTLNTRPAHNSLSTSSIDHFIGFCSVIAESDTKLYRITSLQLSRLHRGISQL